MKRAGWAACALLPFLAAPLQARQGVTPQRVDEAIRRGIEHLRTAPSPAYGGNPDSDELILLTFVHADVSIDDPKVQAMLENVLFGRLRRLI